VLAAGRELIPGPDSPALHLIQQVRDEAHRFAVAGHRQRRSRVRQGSALDGIEGLGPARRRSLLKAFGGLAGLRQAGEADLARVPGIGPALAERIYARLHGGLD
jgi:excinuclease ABC subunit C